MHVTLNTPSLLVAAPHLQDPNFAQTVQILLAHNQQGGFGVIVNRPTPIPLESVLKFKKISIPKNINTWCGGPVGTDHGLILCHSDEPSVENGSQIAPGITLAFSEEHLRALIERGVGRNESNAYMHSHRFIVGYAGWGPGQLDHELKEGAWLQFPLQKDIIFNTPWNQMWEKTISGTGVNPYHIVTPAQEFLN